MHVLAADGALSQNIATEDFRLPNCKFIFDKWHLFDSVLPLRFGQHHYKLVEPYLKKMACSESKISFDDAYNEATKVLRNQFQRNLNAEEQLTAFFNDKDCYANYTLSRHKGTMGRNGSSISESNHSSVKTNLNDGDKFSNECCESPMTVVKDLILRETKHVNEWNQLLCNHRIKFDTEMLSYDVSTHGALKKAADALCLNSHLRFKDRLLRLPEHRCDVVNLNHSKVTSIKYVNAAQRNFHRESVNEPFRCDDCKTSMSFMEQCEHSLVANGELFVLEKFGKQHMQRLRVEGSYFPEF